MCDVFEWGREGWVGEGGVSGGGEGWVGISGVRFYNNHGLISSVQGVN